MGPFNVERDELKSHLKDTYSDDHREVHLGVVDDLSWPVKPTVDFNRNTPTITKVSKMVQKASGNLHPVRTMPHTLIYKSFPKVLRQLHWIMTSAWRKRCICKAWRPANGVYIRKEQNSTAITQCRPISHPNVEGKIIFSVMAGKVKEYLLRTLLHGC